MPFQEEMEHKGGTSVKDAERKKKFQGQIDELLLDIDSQLKPAVQVPEITNYLTFIWDIP